MIGLRQLFRRKQTERQLDKELRFHFEQQVSDLVESGMSETEARRRTRIEFGGIEQVKEECRAVRGTIWLETTLADLRFALRVLRRSPGYALACIGTLALGIGANTAMFSVLNAALLRPLGYANESRIVWATEFFPRFNQGQVFVPEYLAWRAQNSTFDQLEAYGISGGVNLSQKNRTAQRIQNTFVTPGFLSVFGIAPELGRAFRADEDEPGHEKVAVLSDALWRSYFQGDREIVGKRMVLDGAAYTVVGVMPARFLDPTGAETAVWLPKLVSRNDATPARGMSLEGGVIGRLKQGVSAEQARANLEVVSRHMDAAYPPPWSGYHAAAHPQIVPLQTQLAHDATKSIFLLMGSVGLLLLISCANVGNMFLSRAVARQKEIAIRLSVGASRFRVVRLLWMESFAVSTGGALVGLVLLKAAVSTLTFLLPAALPPHVPIDGRVLGFTFACLLLTSLGVGLASAFAAWKVDFNDSLKSGGLAARVTRRFSVRRLLAAGQLAVCMVLLVGSGLLLRSFVRLLNVDPGFNPHHVLLAEVSLAPLESYTPSRQAEYFDRVLQSVKQIPGVQYAAVTDESPLAAFQSIASGLAAEGRPASDDTVVPSSISKDYFRALQIPLLEGRSFDERDVAGSQRVAILNAHLARILFPDRNPIGRRIRFGEGEDPFVTVVGVVADIRHRSLDGKVWSELYQPFQQSPTPWMSVVVKTTRNATTVAPAARQAIASIDPSQAVFAMQSLDGRLSESVRQRRKRTELLGLFALLALLIAAAGVYGVLAYSVARRTNELGVRFALGASPANVFSMVMAEGLKVSVAGLCAGICGAIALTRLMATFLYGITALDPATFLCVSAVLLLVASAAVYLPARRAAKVSPLQALRQD